MNIIILSIFFLIYSNSMIIPSNISSYKSCIITPINQNIINREIDKPKIFIRENTELYNKVTKKYIDSIPLNDTKWVIDLIDKKITSEKVYYREETKNIKFLIAKSPDYDENNILTLKLLVIPYNKEIRCIRDIRIEHLEMLKIIKKRVKELCKTEFHCDYNQLRFYIHYFPSFWHFHIHISIYNVEEGYTIDRAHLLDDIIEGLEKDPLYCINTSFTYKLL